jgi:outer membrane protein assembly factor BamA
MPNNNSERFYYFTRSLFDSLNHAYFPSSGVYFLSEWKKTRAEIDYQIWKNYFSAARSIFSVYFFYRGEFSTSLGDALPNYDEIIGGGIQSFMGLREGELNGPILMTHRLGFQLPIPRSNMLFWDRVYVEGFGDLGGAWSARNLMAWNNLIWGTGGGLGFDTKIGSIQLVYGHSDSGSKQFYISVGKSFFVQSAQ